MHFPHLGNVDLFLYFSLWDTAIGVIFGTESREFKEKESPYFSILFHQALDISYKNILLLIFEISKLDNRETIDSFLGFDSVNLEKEFVVDIFGIFGAVF